MSLHTDAIMDAIVAAVKKDLPDGGIESYPETFPLAWVKKAMLPCLFLGLNHVELKPGEVTLQGEEQHYRFDLVYVMENGSHQLPRKVARQRAEQIVDALSADRTLGITAFEVGDSSVGMLQSDNEVQAMLLENEIPRTAVWLTFQVDVSE